MPGIAFALLAFTGVAATTLLAFAFLAVGFPGNIESAGHVLPALLFVSVGAFITICLSAYKNKSRFWPTTLACTQWILICSFLLLGTWWR